MPVVCVKGSTECVSRHEVCVYQVCSAGYHTVLVIASHTGTRSCQVGHIGGVHERSVTDFRYIMRPDTSANTTDEQEGFEGFETLFLNLLF